MNGKWNFNGLLAPDNGLIFVAEYGELMIDDLLRLFEHHICRNGISKAPNECQEWFRRIVTNRFRFLDQLDRVLCLGNDTLNHLRVEILVGVVVCNF